MTLRERWYWFWHQCGRCGGKGVVYERGRRLRPAELTAAEYADYLVQGGPYFEAIPKPCPKCSGTGMKKRKVAR